MLQTLFDIQMTAASPTPDPRPNLDPSLPRSLDPSPLRPITKVRKWGVSNFGTLNPFDSQPRRNDILGPKSSKVLKRPESGHRGYPHRRDAATLTGGTPMLPVAPVPRCSTASLPP